MALPPKTLAIVPNTLSSNDHNNIPEWIREWHVMVDVLYSATGFLILRVLCRYSLLNFNQSAFWVPVTLYMFTGIFGITLISDFNLTHWSFKLPKYLRYLFAYIGFHALQGMRSVIMYHATFMVNSVGHIWGRQTWNTSNYSKNNWFIHLYSFGDGWPNNHHAIFECLKWWKINVTWYMVTLLEYVGLATNGGSDMNKARKWHLKNSVSRTVLLVSVHGLCLFAPSNFSWTAFWVMMMIGVITTLFGINLSYHRNLSHKSFKLPKYLEYLFAYFGLLALQGDPIFWVSTHRYHHKFTDTDKDPHSPLQGFWFSHISWIFNHNKLLHEGGYSKNVADLKRQFYYRFLQKTIVFHVLLLPVLLYKYGGFPFIVWGMGVRTMITYHATFMVNSICHIWGHQAWNTGDLSKNNWFVGLFAFGEGWHNNHHAFEFSARHGLEWWQIDMTWYVIQLLERAGLATDVKLPSKILKQKMSFKEVQE